MLRVFIADDSEVLRIRLFELLSEVEGIEIVGQAKNGVEASNLIWALQPDVVILDIRMNGGSGIDALKTIKKYDSAPLVMIFTNYPSRQYRKRCLEGGADFFFDKSTEFGELIDVFRDLMKNPQYKSRIKRELKPKQKSK
jgi:DNA-binding NarL/FixJ family response regulator